MVNTCSTRAFISAIIQDDFEVNFVVPSVLHLSDMVAVLVLVKYIFLFCKKIHEVTSSP